MMKHSHSLCSSCFLLLALVSSLFVENHRVWSFTIVSDNSRHRFRTSTIRPKRISTLSAATFLNSASAAAAAAEATQAQNEDVQNVVVPRPPIHWTVPGFKRGWQDAEGNWFDEEGPRNGPVMNYWRQMIDEKAYEKDMTGLSSIMTSSSTENTNTTEDLEAAVRKLEKDNRVSKPTLSRKILGRWACIMRYGQFVASSDAGTDENISVPFVMEVFRPEGRKFADKTAYGIFDQSLQDGDALSIRIVANEDTHIINYEARASSNKKDPPTKLPGFRITNNEEQPLPFYFGGSGITYLSDYLMVTRAPDGNNEVDFWIRNDDAYLGTTKAQPTEENPATTEGNDSDGTSENIFYTPL